MEPGQFEGVIGRTFDESTPWWPTAPSAPEGAPNVVHRAARRRRLRAVRLLRLRHRHADASTGSRRAACATRNFHTTALCSPTRACLLTGRNHHTNGMARIVEFAAGLPRLRRHDPAGERVPLRDARAQRVRHLRRRQVAPHAGAGDDDGRAARPLAARPRLRAVLRLPRRRDRPVPPRPRVRQPPGRPAGARRTRATTSPRTSPTTPSLFIKDLRAVDPAKPFFLYFTPGACHAPHQAPRRVHRARTGAASTTGWDAWRDEVFARQVASGLLPEGTSSERATAVDPGVGLAARPTSAASTRG